MHRCDSVRDMKQERSFPYGMRAKRSLIPVAFCVQLMLLAEDLVSSQTVIALEARVVKVTPTGTIASVVYLSAYRQPR